MAFLFFAALALVFLVYSAFQLYRALWHGETRPLGDVAFFNDEPALDRQEDRFDFWWAVGVRAITLVVGLPVVIKLIAVGISSL